jgi:phosphate transport system permease protein
MSNQDLSTSKSAEQGNSMQFITNLPLRHRIGKIWVLIFQLAMVIGIVALAALILNIVNDSSGYMAFTAKIDPLTLAGGKALETLTSDELNQILVENTTKNRYKTIFKDKPFEEWTQPELLEAVFRDVVKPTVLKTWSFIESLKGVEQLREELTELKPKEASEASFEYKSWISTRFLSSPQNSDPLLAGLRTAILGSLWIIGITMLFAIPIGIGAAVYLEEFANQEFWINKVIQTNINNLAAIPSIIYGMLGLTIFVRWLGPITSGAAFGYGDLNAINGRTILSGGLTLGLLVLPIVIINSQEAIRAVPDSLRQAGYGLGATKLQTIWAHVLPNAIPGILTGTILAVSRAFGETAPLIVVGVSTFITVDPSNIFSQFTSLPAQIYQWTSKPQDVWRNLAAAAIIALMVLLLALNALAILLRNKYSKKY